MDLQTCSILYSISGALSLGFLLVFFILSRRTYKEKKRGKKVLSSLHLFTIGVFCATVLIFLPYYYTNYCFGDSHAIVRPFLISIHHTLRVFILDGEFDTIIEATAGLSTAPHVFFTFVAAVLYVLAPALTFSNVLSMFKNIVDEIRFSWHKVRPFYIFSELNERSVALAESISERTQDKRNLKQKLKQLFHLEPKQGPKRKSRPVIVFTDVFEQGEEKDYELLLKAHDVNAICLKRDITRLNVKKKKGQVEFFLMGDDESENMVQAIKLTDENKDLGKKRKKGDACEEKAECEKKKDIGEEAGETREQGNACKEKAECEKNKDAGEDVSKKRKKRDACEEKAKCEKKKHKEAGKRSIFLFSSRPSAGYILDSVDKGDKMVNELLMQEIQADPAAFLYNNGPKDPDQKIDGGFYIRRLDSVELLAKRILTDDALIDPLFEAAAETGKISLLIVGLGEYGKVFMKVALWLYQICGVQLDICVIDSKDEEELRKSLKQDWPEIMEKNPSREPGDANYRIRFFANTNCFSSDLDELFEKEGSKEVLKNTQLAFVTLGDDEKNIETAVTLRRLFVSVSAAAEDENKEKITEPPLIYSVVYDDKKATSLTGLKKVTAEETAKKTEETAKKEEKEPGLVNHKGTSYHIRFVGNLKSQFSYDVIEREKKIEAKALRYHLEWVAKARQLRLLYEDKALAGDERFAEFRNSVDRYFERKKAEYMEYIREHPTDKGWVRDWKDAYLFEEGSDGKPDYERFNMKEIKSMIDNYFNFEYYRLSSIAKVVHKSVLDAWERILQVEKPKDHWDGSVCGCDYCKGRRITEHMRWNAYMRVTGYKYNEKRVDRARFHNDLVPWDALDELEKYKDEN